MSPEGVSVMPEGILPSGQVRRTRAQNVWSTENVSSDAILKSVPQPPLPLPQYGAPFAPP